MEGLDTANQSPTEENLFVSIGGLAQATGIPVATLRTWERRHGLPRPQRLPSGHRRYAAADVALLLRVKALMEGGIRAADALRSVMAAAIPRRSDKESVAPEGRRGPPAPPQAPVAAGRAMVSGARELDRALQAIAALDGDGLDDIVQRSWQERGAIATMERLVAPLLAEVGRRWRAGTLDVHHEHFASERLRDLLAAQWRPLAAQAAVRVIATTLPGERHVLGLHMAAAVLALQGVGTVFLGAETPVGDVAAAAQQTQARAVIVSMAEGGEPHAAYRALAAARAALPAQVTLVVGGAGSARWDLPLGVRRLHDLDSLADWAARLRHEG